MQKKRDSQAGQGLLKFVLDPQKCVVFDGKQALPGEALWLQPTRQAVAAACAEGAFRTLDAEARWVENLPDFVERQMHKHLLETLHLLRRSGALVSGFEKVRAALERSGVVMLVQAHDASADGRAKLAKLAAHHHIEVVDVLKREDLASVTGQENQVHLAVLQGGLAERFQRECAKLVAYGIENRESGTEKVSQFPILDSSSRFRLK